MTNNGGTAEQQEREKQQQEQCGHCKFRLPGGGDEGAGGAEEGPLPLCHRGGGEVSTLYTGEEGGEGERGGEEVEQQGAEGLAGEVDSETV